MVINVGVGLSIFGVKLFYIDIVCQINSNEVELSIVEWSITERKKIMIHCLVILWRSETNL